jgi:hypothetical protein
VTETTFLQFLVATASFAAVVATFPIDVIEARIRHETSDHSAPAVISIEDCSSASRTPQVSSTEFRERYPGGLYVVCDATVSREHAKATVLRFLFNASRGEVLLASTIEADLVRPTGAWRVRRWHKVSYDYAPPVPPAG